MKTAFYHLHGPEGLRAEKVHVVEEHEDGTIDISREGPKAKAFCTHCRVVDQPKEGHCTKDDAPAPKAAEEEEQEQESGAETKPKKKK